MHLLSLNHDHSSFPPRHATKGQSHHDYRPKSKSTFDAAFKRMRLLLGIWAERHVRPTLEVLVTESPTHLRKVKDTETGLALIRPAA